MIAFPYYGGKGGKGGQPQQSPLADYIISLFPKHEHYVEAYGGSGAVLINKRPSRIETYNDLDQHVVTFFRVLRDQPEALLRLLQLTPWSRDEFERCRQPAENLSEIEIARRFYTRVRQGRNAIPRTGRNGWKYVICPDGRTQSCPETWQKHLPTLEIIAARFAAVQIECSPAYDVIRRFDRPGTLFYLDPTYLLSTRSKKSSPAQRKAYVHEMSSKQHLKMLWLLKQVKGKVVLSGYHSRLYSRALRDWHQIEIPTTASSSPTQDKRTEVLFLNYEPPFRQLSFDLEEAACK